MGAAAGPAQRAVLEVGRVADPFAEALGFGGFLPARGRVRVGEGEQVWGDGGVVGLGEAWEAEGAGFEEAGGRGGRRRGLVRVEGAAVEFWGAELVSGDGVSSAFKRNWRLLKIDRAYDMGNGHLIPAGGQLNLPTPCPYHRIIALYYIFRRRGGRERGG